MFRLIDLDLRCSTSKLIWSLGNNLFSKLSTSQGKNAGFIWFDFYCNNYGLMWFNFYLEFVAQDTMKKPASSSVTP